MDCNTRTMVVLGHHYAAGFNRVNTDGLISPLMDSYELLCPLMNSYALLCPVLMSILLMAKIKRLTFRNGNLYRLDFVFFMCFKRGT